ncbi:MAG: efflux RND transporter periplasmic adaptor subunit [Planctomycetes bacterium]|nr:efflux RND transporter periplasmic adaptor subunit [Planctomycetota bacterium]
MNGRILMLFGVAAFAGIGSLVASSQAPPAPDSERTAADDKRPHVEIARPIRKTIYRKLAVPGDVLPFEQAAIHARVQGYIETISVDRGTRVKAGNILAKISVPETESKLARQNAELALCAPTIQRDTAALEWKETIWRRLQEVSTQAPDLVSREALDDALGAYRMAEAELELARAQEVVLTRTIEETRTMLDLAVLKAPFDGVITERWVDAGDLVQPGSTKIVHVMKCDPVRVRFHVPQSDVPFIRSDSEAEMTFDELPGKRFTAPVARVFWALAARTRTMAAEIDLDNRDAALRPGMFGHVVIELEARPDALVLPASALVTEKKKAFVFVVQEGVARKKAIKIGLDDGRELEVLDGLEADDDVVVAGKSLIGDGDPVRATTRP